MAVLLISSSAAALSIGDEPPPVVMRDTTGAELDLRSLDGKVILVDFWASWCGPCRREMPFLQKLHERYARDGLVVVGVSIDKSTKKMNKFLRSTPVTFRIVHDPEVEVASKYELETVPSSYLIGRDGRIRSVHEGFEEDDAATLEAHVKRLLAEVSDEG